jgi:HNH endonuclease
MPKGIPLDLTNVRFTRLTAISLHGTNVNKHRVWECLCDCGATVYATVQNLQRGKVKSCGCLKREGLPTRMTHGHSRRGDASGTYSCWQSMRARCNRPSHPNYSTFGGLGITICERWRKFENFLADMGERPTGLQIGRIDTSGNFDLENCKWETVSEKGLNKRTNHRMTANGMTKTFGQWAEHLGIGRVSLWERLQKWPLEKALTTPKPTLGKSEKTSYGSNWSSAKRTALRRANGVCQICKKAKSPLHVHHKIPIRYFKNPEDGNYPGNLMPVCHKCHVKEHKEMESRYPLLDTIPFEVTARRSRRDIRRFITWRGQTKTLSEWAKLLPDKRFPGQFLWKRLKTYPLDKAMEPLITIIH